MEPASLRQEPRLISIVKRLERLRELAAALETSRAD
jgi:hypothetical protein